MKRVIVVSIFLIFTTPSLWGKKIYDVESGIVKMTTSSDINIGVSSNSIKSTSYATVYFSDYGDKLVVDNEEVSYDKKNSRKTKMVMVENIAYMVNYDEKSIIKMDISQIPFINNLMDFKSLKEQFNLKKDGYDKILGYKCEIYKGDQMELCIYKKVPLKSSSRMFGTSSTIATSAKFNISISDKEFKLPDFPIQSMDNIYKNGKNTQMDLKDAQKAMEAMDKAIKNMTPEQKEQLQNLMENLSN